MNLTHWTRDSRRRRLRDNLSSWRGDDCQSHHSSSWYCCLRVWNRRDHHRRRKLTTCDDRIPSRVGRHYNDRATPGRNRDSTRRDNGRHSLRSGSNYLGYHRRTRTWRDCNHAWSLTRSDRDELCRACRYRHRADCRIRSRNARRSSGNGHNR